MSDREQLNEMKKFLQMMEDISLSEDDLAEAYGDVPMSEVPARVRKAMKDNDWKPCEYCKNWEDGFDPRPKTYGNLCPKCNSEPPPTMWMRGESIEESDPDDTDWDAHWAREDGDDERADDLEADAEFARMDDELDEDTNDNWGVGDYVVAIWDKTGRHGEPLKVTGVYGDQVRVVDDYGNSDLMFPEDLRLAPSDVSETGWGNWTSGDDEEDEKDHHEVKDKHAERPHTSGYNKLSSGSRAAADSRAQAFMFDEDSDPDGMGSYDILWNDESWKEAIPYDVAEKEVQRILQIIDDSALQAHDNNDHLRVKKIEDGDSMEWTVLDPSDGDYQVVRVQPSDMPAGYTGESVNLESIVESVLEEYPGQPKDYDESDYDPDEADQREMADDMDDEFEKDYIDPEIEDEELGLRFD